MIKSQSFKWPVSLGCDIYMFFFSFPSPSFKWDECCRGGAGGGLQSKKCPSSKWGEALKSSLCYGEDVGHVSQWLLLRSHNVIFVSSPWEAGGVLGVKSMKVWGPLRSAAPGFSYSQTSPYSAFSDSPKSPFKWPYQFMAPVASAPDEQTSAVALQDLAKGFVLQPQLWCFQEKWLIFSLFNIFFSEHGSDDFQAFNILDPELEV